MNEPSTIDLMNAEPGTRFLCRDGTRVIFTNRVVGTAQHGKFRFEIDGVTHAVSGSPMEVFRFRDGAFSTDISGRDVVAIDDSASGVDLSQCVPGQLVRLRNNSISKYNHRTMGPNDGRPYKVGAFYYDQKGRTAVGGSTSAFDVVQVLSATAKDEAPGAPPPPRGIPMEGITEGTRFRRRDGKLSVFTKHDPSNQQYPYKCECEGLTDTYTDRGFYMQGPTASNPKDLVSIFKVSRSVPITREEAVAALTTLVAKLKKEDANKAKILLTVLK